MAANINRTSGSQRRRRNRAACFEFPLFLAGLTVKSIQMAIVTAKINHSGGDGWGRSYGSIGFKPPFFLTGLAIQSIQMNAGT
ncbi:MAG: hypothetical protein BroJett011_25620 [Chloroflexota bacterium]|nr:MAG: hypothetical protein BroJett011_25620 [Chloroflexota bacterium]